MQLLSTRLEFVNTSATAKVHNLVLKKQKVNEKVINLSVGEPDFSTPENIRKAGLTAIKSGRTQYTSTAGLDLLKIAISDKFHRENSLAYNKNELIICSGGKQVIFNALMATLNPRDEVVIPAPYWVSYPDIVALCDSTPVIVQTNANAQFKLTAEKLEQSLNDKTKWLILNSPGNPSGTVYTEKELTQLCNVLELFPNVNIISDDIYEHILYEGKSFCNIVQVNPSLKNRSLLVNGVSKSYAMTGWRLGYGAGNTELIDAMTTVQSQSTSNASTVSQYAAIEALNGPQTFIERNKFIYQSRRDLTLQILSKSKYIQVIKPMGSFYALPSIQKLIGKSTPDGKLIKSDSDFVLELLNKTGVAVVPGSAFGARNTFRISYAVPEALIQEGCYLILDFVESLK